MGAEPRNVNHRMCGFAGVVVWEDRYRIVGETLGRMSRAIAHRGPDGEGAWINHAEAARRDRPQCALAHRRLAVIDPAARADQPFTDGQGRWIVYNGEIYNFRELRAELSRHQPDYEWRSQCDTEVLLRAYDAWGARCVDRFNGMFALAIWDERARSLYLSRDRMGQKPLYYAAVTPEGRPWNGVTPEPIDVEHSGILPPPGRGVASTRQPLGAIAFASELGALRPLEWIDTSLDRTALGDYLAWGYIPAPRTIQCGARKMPPAQYASFMPERIVAGEYFNPNDICEPVEDDEAAESTRELLRGAVKRQLISDVPIGCFLSGGIDSSIIAAAMKAAAEGQEVLTFSIGFEDARYDETQFAAKVAQRLGTTHREFIVRPDAVEDLPKLARAFGEPFGDSSALPTHYLAQRTREQVKVALSGDGGDELFGGYDRYGAMRLAQKLQRIPGPLRALLSPGIVAPLRGTHPKSIASRSRRFLKSLNAAPAERYAGYVRLFDARMMRSIWNDPLARSYPGWVDLRYAELLKDGRVVEAALATDRVTYLPDDLLVKIDRAAMLHALEVRSPFMDHDLVRFAARLSRPQLLRGGAKRLLREAFARDLPEEVFRRPKMGFAVPIGEWFRTALGGMLRDHLFAADSFASDHFDRDAIQKLIEDHDTRAADHSQRLYALLMLELWRRETRGAVG